MGIFVALGDGASGGLTLRSREGRARRRRLLVRGRALGAVAMAGALVLGIAAPSSASSSEELESGLWYFERGHVQDAHDAGFDGSGVTIAVIDTQLNPDAIGLRGANIEIREPSYCYDEAGEPYPATSTDYIAAHHGTNVASMIVGTGEAPAGGVPIKGVAPGASLLYYNASVPADPTDPMSTEIECTQANGSDLRSEDDLTGQGVAILDAIDAGADIISISSTFNFMNADAIAKAHAAGVVVVVALVNDQLSQMQVVPNGAVGVQSFDADGMIQSTTTWGGAEPHANNDDQVVASGPGVGVLLQGTRESWDAQSLSGGTSFATPIVAGFLAVVKQKYPDATAGQLIQSLIHNTGTKGEHEPEWNSSTGYGAASLTGMLAVDPTKYPDVNPIFDADDEFASPSAADVREAEKELEAAAVTPTPSADEATTQSAPPALPAWLPWAIGGGIVAALLIIGGVILALILAARGARRRNAESEERA